MAQSSTASLVILTESCMHFFTQKQTARRGSINNSSKSYHHRTASSEICYFANEQKTTANRNSSDSFKSLQLCSFVALGSLMYFTPVRCISIYFFTLHLPKACNLGSTHLLALPLVCADDGRRIDLSSAHLQQSPF